MSAFEKLTFDVDLGFVKLGGELSDKDRQCAWELYTEIATRVAVVGKRTDEKATNFDGELYLASLESLYIFFKAARKVMRRFPVGRIKDPRQVHLGVLINRLLARVFRPFLEKWNGPYRAWWDEAIQAGGNSYDIQKTFPNLDKFLEDWTALRLIMRRVECELASQYDLVPLDDLKS